MGLNLKEKAKQIKIFLPALFIAMKKRETPVSAKIVAGITVVYALSPIDLIPDFIPFLGYLDDIVILPILAAIAIKLIPEDIMDKCKAEAEGIWAEGKPKKWYYAIPIVIIWLIILLAIFLKIFSSIDK